MALDKGVWQRKIHANQPKAVAFNLYVVIIILIGKRWMWYIQAAGQWKYSLLIRPLVEQKIKNKKGKEEYIKWDPMINNTNILESYIAIQKLQKEHFPQSATHNIPILALGAIPLSTGETRRNWH